MPLYPDQQAVLDETRKAFAEGCRSPIIRAPTSWGKSFLGIEIIRGVLQRGGTAWWLVHRRELIQQASGDFREAGIPHSTIYGGQFGNPHAAVQIGSIQTICNRLDYLPAPTLIIFDEAHHCAANSWIKILNKYPNVPRIGVTATPQRHDGKGLGKWFDRIIYSPEESELIEMKRLADYKLLVANIEFDPTGMKTIGGDYSSGQLYERLKGVKRTGDIVQHYGDVALPEGYQAICFAVNVADSIDIADSFVASGIRAAHIDGSMDPADRKRIFDLYRYGNLDVLVNCEILGEGVHVHGTRCVIQGRPTKSLSVHKQQIGRAFKYYPDDRPAIFLDHANNAGWITPKGFIENHGLPDKPQIWSLEDTPRRKKDADPSISIRLCRKCQACLPASAKVCKFCGERFVADTDPVRVEAGTLVVVSRAEAKIQAAAERARIAEEKRIAKELQADLDRRKRAEEKQARIAEEKACATVEELAELGRQRGYKYPRHWAERRWVFVRPRTKSQDIVVNIG